LRKFKEDFCGVEVQKEGRLCGFLGKRLESLKKLAVLVF